MGRLGYILCLGSLVATVLIVSCVPTDYQGEGGGTGAHGAGGGGGGGGFFSLFGGGKVGAFGGKLGRGALNMMGLTLKSANGRWTPELTAIARKEVITHPNLINGIPGFGNPLAGICDNFLSLSEAQRINVLLKVAPSLADGEAHLGKGGNGGEANAYNRALGPFQISKDAKNFGCWVGGYAPQSYPASLDCVYKIMDSQYTNHNLPIANNDSHWSVMMPKKYLSTKFMPTFQNLAPQPECTKSYAAKPSKNYPGAEIAGQATKGKNDNAG